MGYKYQEIDINRWGEITKDGAGIFGRKDFLSITSQVYGYNLLFCLITSKETPVLALPLFTKGNKILFPNHYFYQYVWEIDREKEPWLSLDAWDVLLQELKSRYDKIKIRLPISVIDTRPFIWNNFSMNVKYTYVKKLDDLSYHHNVKRILKKENLQYSFKKNCDWDKNWMFHQQDLRNFGVREIHIHSCIEYFKELKNLELVQVFNSYYNDKFLTSIIVIVDKIQKTAYFPLIGTADQHYNSGLPTLLYNYSLQELKAEGFDSVDLVGANIKNIAKFKSKFLPDLASFYEVSYSNSQEKRQKIFLSVKKFLGKVLFWVRV